MALLQNQFALATLAGTKVSGSNVLPVQFYSASASDTIAAGEMVKLAATAHGQVTKVVKGSALTDQYFGVVLTNPLKESYAVGEKMEIGILGTVVQMTASAAITAGAMVQYAYDTFKVATRTASNTIVGWALEDCSADGDLVRVMMNLNGIAGPTGATGATGATGPTGPTGLTGG